VKFFSIVPNGSVTSDSLRRLMTAEGGVSMWGEHEGMGWWMLIGSVWFVLFWVVIIWVLARVLGWRNGAREHDESAIEIARRRYARGEISRDEFEQIRRDLST
jgi:putative membrane protein